MIPFMIIFFLLVGLVWSGGQVGWLVALGAYIAFSVIVQVIVAVTKEEVDTKRR